MFSVVRSLFGGPRAAGGPPARKRFLSDRPRRDAAFLQAAKDYVAAMRPADAEYLYRKPFPEPFEELYDVLNLLRTLGAPPGGRVLEVGCGPGWLTEVLLCLGYQVDALAPCADMLRIASQRVADFARARRLPDPPPVAFHCATLEDCPLPDACCDAVVFVQSLHHVLDEERCLAQCFRVLKPGGVLGVAGEPVWRPGDRTSEAFWEKEMRLFGAVENPFTKKYLKYLLDRHGFERAVWYHGVNGLVPAAPGGLRVSRALQRRAENLHTVTARKPGGRRWTAADRGRRTRADIAVLEASCDPATRAARLKVRLTNRGETDWPHSRATLGCVSLALYQRRPFSFGLRSPAREAMPRARLPRTVPPGDAVVFDAEFLMPEDYRARPWRLDLVCENLFWFGRRGTRSAVVCF
jgi:SAM-dependent methyltransferase